MHYGVPLWHAETITQMQCPVYGRCICVRNHHTNATPCLRALPLRLLQYQVCNQGGRVWALVESIPLKKKYLIHITHWLTQAQSNSSFFWQLSWGGRPLKTSLFPLLPWKWGLLVEVGLCALLFGRFKQFWRGGGYTPNLEKQILLETGVKQFNRRENETLFKVIWDPTYISTYVDSFARHSLFSDKVCHRTWSRHLSTFETLHTLPTT